MYRDATGRPAELLDREFRSLLAGVSELALTDLIPDRKALNHRPTARQAPGSGREKRVRASGLKRETKKETGQEDHRVPTESEAVERLTLTWCHASTIPGPRIEIRCCVVKGCSPMPRSGLRVL